MRSIAVWVLAVSLCATGTVWAAADLDGTQWKMREKKQGDAKPDILKFDHGQFTSTECIPYGFTTGPYQSSKEGTKLSWSATQTNGKGEKMEWNGKIEKGQMLGSYVFTDEKGKTSKETWTAKKAK